jgi:hypothetical protein
VKYLRADFRFMLPHDFDGTTINAMQDAIAHLKEPEIPPLRLRAARPTPHAESQGINGHPVFYNNSLLGHRFTGFLGAYDLDPACGSSWVELPSGILAHGSTDRGWIK